MRLARMELPAARLRVEDRFRFLGRKSAPLLRFAVDADASPWHGFQARRRYVVFAFHAYAVSAVVDPVDRFFDSAEQFRVGLFQRETDVQIAFLAGLVDPIAALRARVGGRCADGGCVQQFILFRFQDPSILL